MEDVVIIIINWNNTDTTIECLKSIGNIYKTIVVDNNSRPSEHLKLKNNLGNNTHLISNDKNLGFAGGNNVGIGYVAKHYNPTYIMLLNSDTAVTEGFMIPLLEDMNSDPKTGAIQPKILKLNDIPTKPIIDSAGQIAFSHGSVRDIGLDNPDGHPFSQKKEVFGACGAAVLYRTSCLKNTGYFDTELFSLFEDVDLSWRIRLSGYTILYEPKSIIYHKRGVSGKLNEENKKIRGFYGHRNCLITTLKYYPFKYILKFFPIHCYRLFTALFSKFKYRIKDPFWAPLFNALKKRRIYSKQPLLKDLQKKWIIPVGYKDIKEIHENTSDI